MIYNIGRHNSGKTLILSVVQYFFLFLTGESERNLIFTLTFLFVVKLNSSCFDYMYKTYTVFIMVIVKSKFTKIWIQF